MKISQKQQLKLTRHAAIYSPIPTKTVFLENNTQHYNKINHQSGEIYIGDLAPYQYYPTFQLEGYQLFLEGLHFHEIAQMKYTDYQIMAQCFETGKRIQEQANDAAKQFINKQMNDQKLKIIFKEYVSAINLPLILKAIEDGAIENSMGIEHPETWNALLYARTLISKSFINKKHDVDDQSHLMDKIIKEIMVICTYGYRFSLQESIVYLSQYLPEQFEMIRKLAIKGRLQTSTTQERLDITKMILDLCQPIINQTVHELLDTLIQSHQFSHLSSSLFSSQSEIAIHFQNSQQDSSPQPTQSKYLIDINQEEFENIEALENQNEKVQQQELLQELYKRQKETEKQQEKSLKKEVAQAEYLKEHLVFQKLERTSPSQYGAIALRTIHQSIVRSNQLARMLKRERMYASHSTTKHKKEYGRQLDQPYLYRATIDGRVFKEHKEGKKKDLCVYILVDNSESMSGDKIVNTMKGCYEVARVLQILHIPFSISTHKSLAGKTVQITDLITFQECKKRQVLDRIFYMHVSGGTHEEIALEYVLKKLSDYKRHRKGFVFVLSDGDTHGVERIHELTRLYKKERNIDVIGIGIQTTPLITTTYPNSLYIQDIQTLPDMFIKKLREIAI